MRIREALRLLAILSIAQAASSATEAPAAPGACTAPGYREFDFWLGEWEVFDSRTSVQEATATISAVEGGCALREEYRGMKGGGGESLTMYDPLSNRWRQSWISSRGQIVLIEGRKAGDAIELSGAEYGTAAGRLIRGTWTPVPGGVREIAERSSDGGKSWTPWFDILFKPRGHAR